MGIPYGINNIVGKIKIEDSLRILEYAFDNGIHYLDTAESYGNAHEIIGIFHQEKPSKRFNVITKLPHKLNSSFDKKVDKYLEQMNIPEIDTLMFHSFESYKRYGISDGKDLEELKLRGKIKSFGVSVYTNDEIDEVIPDKNVDVIQLPFNLFDNENLRAEVIKKIKSSGKKIHTRSAYLQGLFFKELDSKNELIQSLSSELLYIKEISKEFKIPIHQLALNYCLQQSQIDNVLIGVDSMKQLERNLKAANQKLSDSIMNKINKIRIENLTLINPSLWS